MTDGFGGMMSIVLRTDFEGAKRFCTLLKVITPATSLGGPESLAEHRKLIEGRTARFPTAWCVFPSASKTSTT